MQSRSTNRSNPAGRKNLKHPRSRRRLIALQVCLFVAIGGVAFRLVYDQHAYGARLLKQASRQQAAAHVVLAPRGSILDSEGRPLAYDVPAYYMDLELSQLTADNSQLVSLLATTLHVSPSSVSSLLAKNQSQPWIQWPHPVLEPAKEAIQSGLDALKKGTAVTFSPTAKRVYPYGEFAANTLGYVNQAGVGEAGLEEQYNTLLAGTNGAVHYTQDEAGFPMPGSVVQTTPAHPGDNVETTINQTIQGYVETEMNKLVSQYHPDHAAIIVTNPYTGAILAMSSRPTFNPNTYWTATPEALNNNWAVNSAFEPGSTFKTIVFAAALATKSISIGEKFLSGHTQIDGRYISDWKPSGWGVLTYQQALEYSSNVGFTHIALQLGWANLIRFMHLFGFLDKTGVDLPAEASSIIFPPSQRGPVQLATSGFGQGIAVTPLQQVAAVGAIANGGNLMRPYLAKEILSSNGTVVKHISPTVVRSNFLPQSTVNTVNQTMLLDVTKGIDASAVIPGYNVGGKTGTAQVVDPKTGQYYSNRFIVSFIGYVPVEHPVVEVYVTVDYPKAPTANTWGSTIAVPTARQIMIDCLQFFHVPPNGSAASLATSKAAAARVQTKYVDVPNVVGMNVKAAQTTLQKAGLALAIVGTNGKVSRQWPQAQVQVPTGSKVMLVAASPGHLTMPNLSGLSMREVGNLLTALGVNFVPSGSGYASSQSVAPGQPFPSGSVSVTFSPPPVSDSTNSLATPPSSSGGLAPGSAG